LYQHGSGHWHKGLIHQLLTGDDRSRMTAFVRINPDDNRGRPNRKLMAGLCHTLAPDGWSEADSPAKATAMATPACSTSTAAASASLPQPARMAREQGLGPAREDPR